MTDQTTPPPPPPTPPKGRRWLTPLLVAVALLVGIGIGAAAGAGDSTPDATPAATSAPAGETDTPAPAYTPPPKPVYPDPVVTDYAVTLYTTEKKCFGSAGCNISFTVDLAYGGPELDPSKTYELRYEVTGGEDPYLSTIEIEGDSYTSHEESVSTASQSAELAATVLDIRER